MADSLTIPTLLDPRFDLRRMLLVSPDQQVGLATVEGHEIPEPMTEPVTVHEIRPGALRFDLATPRTAPAYLFVSENYHPAWHAKVDGREARVLRTQYTLMGVPLPVGARSVELVFSSPGYRRGQVITMVALLLVLGTIGVGLVRRRG